MQSGRGVERQAGRIIVSPLAVKPHPKEGVFLIPFARIAGENGVVASRFAGVDPTP